MATGTLRNGGLDAPLVEENNAEGSVLKYGDSISLHCTDLKGYVAAWLSGRDSNIVQIIPDSKRDSPAIFTESVFKIVAKNKAKRQRAFLKIVRSFQRHDATCDDDEAERLAHEQYPELYEAYRMEAEDNVLEQRRRHGDTLYYGQEVQLHSDHFRKYLHVSGTSTSEYEPSNMRTELYPSDGPTATFRIMPRFKVRAEGDPVRIEDQVTLEAMSTPGQFLHSSTPEFRNRNGVHEVNVSVTKSAYVIKLFRSPGAVPDGSICGNDVVQLFHKELGAYIAAEGVRDDHSADWITEDIHVRIRHPDPTKPSRELPPTSAVSFFQIERVASHEGFALVWDDKVRLKHYTTQTYLRCDPQTPSRRRAEGNLEVRSLSLSTVRDANTLFRLDAVIQEDEFVRDGTYSRIQHVGTGYWLHADDLHEYDRRELNVNHDDLGEEFSGLAKRVHGIEWDSAPLRELCVTKERLFDDAFIAHHVPADQVYNVNFINGVIPVFREYTRVRQNTAEKDFPISVHRNTVNALKELRRFFFKRGQEVKQRQKLLRNLKVVEVLIEMLKAPFSGPNSITLEDLANPAVETRKSQEVCDAAANVLKAYLEGNSRKNELYISRHLPFFQYLFGTEISMEAMYTELVRDNLKIVGCITAQEIDKVVDLLAKGDKNHNYLNFLGVLCECEESPIPENQDAVAKRLLCDHDGIVYLTEFKHFTEPGGRLVGGPEEGGFEEMAVTQDGGRTWQRLREFVASALDEDDSTSTPEYLFLQGQLDLFGVLCNGRNDFSIDLITKRKGYLTWRECFTSAQNSSIPWSLRSKYVELMTYLFVDVGTNIDVLSEVQLSYGWEELKATGGEPYHDASDNPEESLSGAHLSFFLPLSEWIKAVLESLKGRMVAEDLPFNRFLAQVLKLLVDLIRFGYYVHKDHIVGLMVPLQSMLDGSNDVNEKPKEEGRNKVNMKRTRFASISPTIVSFKGKPDKPVVTPQEEFQQHGRYEGNRDNSAIMEVKIHALKAMDALFNLVATIRVQVLMYDYTCLMQSDLEGKPFMGKLTASDFKSLLAMYHAAHDPRKAHANNVDQLCKGDGDAHLAEYADHARKYLERLVDRTAYVHKNWNIKMGGVAGTLPAILLDLCKYEHPTMVLESMNILAMLYGSQDDLLKNARDGLILMHPGSVALATRLRGETSTLRELSERHIHGHDQEAFCRILSELGQLCRLPGEHESPHAMNQQIIVNSNIIGIMLNVVKSQYPQESTTLEAVFEFLTSLAFKNEAVQTEVFDYLNDMLRCESSDQDIETHTGTAWVNSMAHCVGEIFNGNRHTCLRVLPSQIEKMVQVLAEFTTDAPEMLTALRSVAKLEDLNIPLQRNQNIIMKAITLHRSVVVDAALIDDRSDPVINDQRMSMLRGANVATPRTQRKRSVTLTKEDMQRPAVTAVTPKQGASLRRYHLNLVELLAACAEGENQLIESMCQTIFSVDELLEVMIDKEILPNYKTAYIKFFLWVYLNTEGGSDGTADLMKDSMTDGRRLYDSLHLLASTKMLQLCDPNKARSIDDDVFAFDAFLPFVSKVATKFYDATQPTATEKLKVTGSVIGQFTVQVLPTLFNRMHMKILASCLNDMDTSCKESIPPKAQEVCGRKLMAEEVGVNESPAMRVYAKAHGREEMLNRNFNTYAHVLGSVYAGHNTIESQLSRRFHAGHPRHEHISEHYTEEAGEDQALPLSREFQAFIELFTDGGVRHSKVLRPEVTTIVKHYTIAKKLSGSMDADEHERQNEVLAKLLQVFRGMLHNERVISPLEEHEPSYVRMQDTAVEFDVILAVSSLLNSEDDDVVREALALLIQVLEGGNPKAQDAFEDHFLHTREETFFDDIQTRLRRSTESIVEKRTLARQAAEEKAREKKMMGTMTMREKFNASSLIEADAAADKVAEAKASTRGVETPNISYNPEFTEFSSSTDGTTINPLHAPRPGADAGEDTDDEDDASTKDEGNIELVLRTLQLMCEGHNGVLQNYIRAQPDNIRSLDLVAEVVKFADVVTEDVDENNIELVVQTFDTLVEFCQGCQGNQAAVFNNHIMDSINRVIRENRVHFRGPEDFIDSPHMKEDPDGPWKIVKLHLQYAKLHLACAQLVLSMMDDSDAATLQMAREIDETLDIRTALRLIDEYRCLWQWAKHHDELWCVKGEDDDEDEEYPTPFEVGYAWFNLLAQLGDFTGEEYHMFSGDPSKGFLAFQKTDLTIEIHRDGRLRKIHFPGAEWAQYLRPEVKHELNWHVERTSPTDKIRDFVTRCRTIIADIKYQRELSSWSAIAHILIIRKGEWRLMLLVVTAVINIMMLTYWKADDGDVFTIEPSVPDWFNGVILVLGIVHLIASMLVCMSYSLVNPPWFRELLNGYPVTQRSIFGELTTEQSYRTRRSPLFTLSLYHYLLVLFSVLGIVYHGYFFGFHLLHIVVDNDILQRVVTAVTRNGSSLLQVSVLMLIIIYIYTLIAFAFYRGSFDADEGAYCQTLGECFVTSIRLGMMSGGGLGEALPLPEVYSFNGPGVRTVFDLTFFVLISIIGLNVVFGIIVDTFSELRDEKQQIQEAMNSECFICSRKAYEFDRYGTAFNEHVKTEHHQWNYLYYMLYLEDLDHTDYDSNQQYFHTALASEAEATVFPINKARCLAKMEDEAEDSAIMNTKILDQLATLLAKMDKMEKSVSEKTALPALPGSPSRPAADAMADFDFDFDDNVATRASVSSDPREDDL